MTVVPLRIWLLLLLSVFTYGCASPETAYTKRDCVIALHGQTAPGQVFATLVCDQEKPYKEGE